MITETYIPTQHTTCMSHTKLLPPAPVIMPNMEYTPPPNVCRHCQCRQPRRDANAVDEDIDTNWVLQNWFEHNARSSRRTRRRNSAPNMHCIYTIATNSD